MLLFVLRNGKRTRFSNNHSKFFVFNSHGEWRFYYRLPVCVRRNGLTARSNTKRTNWKNASITWLSIAKNSATGIPLLR